MYAEFATDPVVQLLSFEDQRHYSIVLCLKCSGVLDRNLSQANRERVILHGLRLSKEEADKVKAHLIDVGFIEEDWQPTAWDHRQYVSDNSTERSRKSRRNKDIQSVAESSAGTMPSVSVSVSDLLTNYINVSPNIWLEFEQHRKEIKKPLTELSRKKNMKILNELTSEQQHNSVDATIANRWTGLFPPKQVQKKTSGKMGRAIDVIKDRYT